MSLAIEQFWTYDVPPASTAVVGSLAITGPNGTLSASGGVVVDGTFAQTGPNGTLAASGTAGFTIPNLTSPAASPNGATKANWSITSDQSGTLYVILSTSLTPPSVVQIQAGQDSSGLAAAYAYSGTLTIGGNGGQAQGLTASTTYYPYFQGHNSAGDSSVISGSSIATGATDFTGIKKARILHVYGMR